MTDESNEPAVPLSWARSDVEQRLGFHGGRYTRVNNWLSLLLGGALTALFYAALVPALDTVAGAMFTRRGPTPYFIVWLSCWSIAILFLKIAKAQATTARLASRLANSGTSPTGRIVRGEVRDRVSHALAQLGPRDREIVAASNLGQRPRRSTAFECRQQRAEPVRMLGVLSQERLGIDRFTCLHADNRQYREFLYNHHWDLANNHMGQRQYIEAAEVALKLPQLDSKQKFKAYSEAADTLVRCATQLDRRANSEAGPVAESTATDKDKDGAKERTAAETYRQAAHGLIKKALQAEDGQPEDLNRLAWFLANSDDLRFRDPSQSVALARKFVQDRPQVARFWTTLGAAHYRAGDDREALKALRKADELGPNDFAVETYLFLALTHQRSSAPDEAKQYFDRGIARMDTNEHGRDTTNDEDLKTLRQEAAQALRIDEAP